MSIKFFGLEIGASSNGTTVRLPDGGQIVTTRTHQGGFFGIFSPVVSTYTYIPPPPPPPPPPQVTLKNVPAAPLPGPATSMGRAWEVPPLYTPEYIPPVDPQAFSQLSAIAPYETLFHDFQIEAFPFYNFWTPDERTNDKEARGNRKLEDVPRFIKVVWNSAPSLPGLVDVTPRDKINRPIHPVKFSAQSRQGFSVTLKGITFSPSHLQPVNFSQARNSLANGYLGPGILDSVVELPLHNTGLESAKVHSQVDPIHYIDEDAFLAHPDLRGVNINELKAQVHQITNGVIGAASVGAKAKSPAAQRDQEAWFDGKFSISKSPRAGGALQLHSVHASSPALSMLGNSAQRTSGDVFDHVIDMVDKVVHPPNVADVKQSVYNKVKFVQPSIGGVLAQSKVNMMTKPEHAEAMVAVAQIIPHLEVLNQGGIAEKPRKTDIPSFQAPPGLKPIDYIGYVLEKYKRNKNGTFEKVEEIELPNADFNEYYDTKILYGEVYRYRVRGILRWTRPKGIGPFGPEDNVLPKAGSAAANIAQYQSSYFGSEWSQEWAYGTVLDTTPPAYPDELTVRPDSARRRVMVTFRLPDNPQKDIYKMRLFRKLQDANGADLTGWIQVKEYGSVKRGIDWGPQNVLYIDTDVDFFQHNGIRYVYAAQCVSRHDEYSALSEQISTRLNADHKVYGEFGVDFVSCGGVKPEYFGSFSVYPIRRFRHEVVVTPNQVDKPATFSLSGREAAANNSLDDRKYWIRVESLDTGEYRDYQVGLTYNNLKPLVNNQLVGVYVPTHSVEKLPQLKTPSWIKPNQEKPGPQGKKLAPTFHARPGEVWKKG